MKDDIWAIHNLFIILNIGFLQYELMYKDFWP